MTYKQRPSIPLHATVYLPDAANGFYRETRFDWSGVIGDLTSAGHSYYGRKSSSPKMALLSASIKRHPARPS
jgi:hypothetical protein